MDWAIAQGLAPLAAYNLEYRLAGARTRPSGRGTGCSPSTRARVNDNVMKLVNFKRIVDELEGRKLLLLGAAAFAEALYPHVAFRPVLDIQLLLRRAGRGGLRRLPHPAPSSSPETDEGNSGAARVLSDGRTAIYLYADVLGPAARARSQGIFERAKP